MRGAIIGFLMVAISIAFLLVRQWRLREQWKRQDEEIKLARMEREYAEQQENQNGADTSPFERPVFNNTPQPAPSLDYAYKFKTVNWNPEYIGLQIERPNPIDLYHDRRSK